MFESLLCVSDFSFHCDSSFSAIFEPSTYTLVSTVIHLSLPFFEPSTYTQTNAIAENHYVEFNNPYGRLLVLTICDWG